MMVGIISINDWAFAFSQQIASPYLTLAMGILTDSFVVVFPLLLIYLYYKQKKDIPPFVSSIVLLYIISTIIKLIVKEPRPCITPYLSLSNFPGCESGYAFPSSHAAVLAAPYFFVNKHRYIDVLYPIWVLLVMFSRVYLGYHYLTDVIAGVALGLLVGWAVYLYRTKINEVLRNIWVHFNSKTR